MPPPVEFRFDAVEFTPQLLEVFDNPLDFEQHRPHHPQIARTMLADEDFVFDFFRAKRALHQKARMFDVTAARDMDISAPPQGDALAASQRFEFRLCTFELLAHRLPFEEKLIALRNQ